MFLTLGNNFVRAWDVTEYKKLFIPLSFLVYAVETVIRAKAISAVAFD